MTSIPALVEAPAVARSMRSAERLELRLTALRLGLLRMAHGVRVGSPPHTRTTASEGLPVVRLDAGRRERMLWRVHDSARAAQRAWELGEDPAEAMHDLSTALARLAEYDV
jgi:hypothetical protein